MSTLYLQFKSGENGPFQTVSVPAIESLLWWQKRGLQFTASGYGSRIPTPWKVQYNNRWYRVYCTIYSNIGTCWIRVNGEKVIVDN